MWRHVLRSGNLFAAKRSRSFKCIFGAWKKCSKSTHILAQDAAGYGMEKAGGVPSFANAVHDTNAERMFNTRLNNSDMNIASTLLAADKAREFLKSFAMHSGNCHKAKAFLFIMENHSRSRTWINFAQSSGTRKILQKLFPRRQTPITHSDRGARGFRREISLAKSETCWALIDYKLSDLLFRSNIIAHRQTSRSGEKKLKPDDLECRLKLALRQLSLADEFVFTPTAKSC